MDKAIEEAVKKVQELERAYEDAHAQHARCRAALESATNILTEIRMDRDEARDKLLEVVKVK